MIALVYALYCTAGAVAAAALLAVAGVHAAERRFRRRCENRYARRYMHIVISRLLDGDAPMDRFPMSGRRGADRVLARTLAAASSSVCFEDMYAVRRMVAANGTEGWLLRRIKRTHGYVRAHYLAMLSSLPVSQTTARCVSRYARSRNRHIRFRTMMVGIASDPSSAMRLLGEYPDSLTPFEMAELSAMLRRGILPLACDPLLNSPRRNLRMLGLNIVRIFGISESESRLIDIITHETDAGFRSEAVYALVSLHLPVARPEIVPYVRTMSICERNALLRHLAREGYSVSTLETLADEAERPYAEALAASYKRSLVWMQ